MSSKDFDLAIIGGGITGLSCGFFALANKEFKSVCLIEPTELGGKIDHVTFETFRLDTAADSIVFSREPVKVLFNELELLPIYPLNPTVKIYTDNKLYDLPENSFFGIPANLKELKASGILSGAGYFMLKRDRFKSRYKGQDISLYDLLEPRIGKEALEKLVEPFVAGINAGIAKELSVIAVAPEIFTFISNYGSLTKAVRKYLKKRKTPSGSLVSANGGINIFLETLINALFKNPTFKHVKTLATEILFKGSSFEILTPLGTINANKLALAIPAKPLSDIKHNLSDELNSWLTSLDHATVATLTIVVDKKEISKTDLARGYLIPRGEGLLTTAVTYLSEKWNYYTNDDWHLIKISAGYHGDSRVNHLTETEIKNTLIDEFSQMIQKDIKPVKVFYKKYPDAFCQYKVGHLLQANKIINNCENLTHNKLKLIGNYFRGVGISSRIVSAYEAALQLAKE
jgi:oxygen-dependent protoporphyrinogen oxidase